MKKLYYLIWSDAISSIRKHHPEKKTWKNEVYILVTFIHSINFWILFMVLKFINVEIPVININLFLGDSIDSFLGFIMTFAWPFLLLNFFLVFYKDKYKRILQKYPTKRRSYAFGYSMVVIIGGFVTFILYAILKQ